MANCGDKGEYLKLPHKENYSAEFGRGGNAEQGSKYFSSGDKYIKETIMCQLKRPISTKPVALSWRTTSRSST